jgi:hypothetical protein
MNFILLQEVSCLGDLNVDGRIITISVKGQDMDPVYLAQNMGQWCAVLSRVMNFLFP